MAMVILDFPMKQGDFPEQGPGRLRNFRSSRVHGAAAPAEDFGTGILVPDGGGDAKEDGSWDGTAYGGESRKY